MLHPTDFTAGNGAVATKDHLLNLLNSGQDTEQTLANVTFVLTLLQHTYGLFSDLEYCYKAVEIADRCRTQLDEMLRNCHHYKRIQRIGELRDMAIATASIYYKLQHESMQIGNLYDGMTAAKRGLLILAS